MLVYNFPQISCTLRCICILPSGWFFCSCQNWFVVICSSAPVMCIYYISIESSMLRIILNPTGRGLTFTEVIHTGEMERLRAAYLITAKIIEGNLVFKKKTNLGVLMKLFVFSFSGKISLIERWFMLLFLQEKQHIMSIWRQIIHMKTQKIFISILCNIHSCRWNSDVRGNLFSFLLVFKFFFLLFFVCVFLIESFLCLKD